MFEYITGLDWPRFRETVDSIIRQGNIRVPKDTGHELYLTQEDFFEYVDQLIFQTVPVIGSAELNMECRDRMREYISKKRIWHDEYGDDFTLRVRMKGTRIEAEIMHSTLPTHRITKGAPFIFARVKHMICIKERDLKKLCEVLCASTLALTYRHNSPEDYEWASNHMKLKSRRKLKSGCKPDARIARSVESYLTNKDCDAYEDRCQRPQKFESVDELMASLDDVIPVGHWYKDGKVIKR